MNGHKLSGTRQWNKHWQSGEEGGGYIPLIPMHDFTYIKMTGFRLVDHIASDSSHYYTISVEEYPLLFLPNYNKIYFYMSSYSNPDYHRFDPIIISCNFEFKINGRLFASNNIFTLYQNHPENFHNVRISKIQLNICGVNKYYYMISFVDSTHNPDEYYIDFVWGTTNENKIKFDLNMICYDDNYDARLESFNNLVANPFHAPDSSGYEAFEYCGFIKDFIPSADIQLKSYNRYYDSQLSDYVYLYNYFMLPERIIEGRVASGLNVNDLFAANGDWKLGTTILIQRVFDFFEGYDKNQNDFPYRIYNTLYSVYRSLTYTDSQSYGDIEIEGNRYGDIQLCKRLNIGTPFYYSDATLFYNSRPILRADFNIMNSYTQTTEVSKFKMSSTKV